ncbi:MAG: glycosyltransferase family 2 protein, partial [Bacteroidota bacterium]
MSIQTLSIIIPAYNEAATIHLILDKVRDVSLVQNMSKEIIVIDDCSKDGTYDAIQAYKENNPELNLRVLRHEVNQGKGAALHTGIREAVGDYVII